MSTQSGALITTGGSAVVGQREDLSDVITRMDPGSTPVLSWFGTGTASNAISHDWEKSDIRAPRRSPANEGNVATNATPVRPSRIANTCEIFYEAYGVSGTAQAVDVAGNSATLDWQRVHKGLELKCDLEIAVLGPQEWVKTDPREMGGIQTYAVNYDIGSSGGTAPSGDGDTTVVYGADQTLDTDLMDTVSQAGWQKGANYSLLVMGSAQKRNFDNAIPVESLADAQIDVTNQEGVTVATTVAIWKSVFGQRKFMMVPTLDKYTASWADKCILGFDERPSYRPKVLSLPGRGWFTERLAKVGDTDQEQIVGEFTLEVPNPLSFMLIGGLSEAYSS
jgi:hypothetical protein